METQIFGQFSINPGNAQASAGNSTGGARLVGPIFAGTLDKAMQKLPGSGIGQESDMSISVPQAANGQVRRTGQQDATARKLHAGQSGKKAAQAPVGQKKETQSKPMPLQHDRVDDQATLATVMGIAVTPGTVDITEVAGAVSTENLADLTGTVGTAGSDGTMDATKVTTDVSATVTVSVLVSQALPVTHAVEADLRLAMEESPSGSVGQVIGATAQEQKQVGLGSGAGRQFGAIEATTNAAFGAATAEIAQSTGNVSVNVGQVEVASTVVAQTAAGRTGVVTHTGVASADAIAASTGVLSTAISSGAFGAGEAVKPGESLFQVLNHDLGLQIPSVGSNNPIGAAVGPHVPGEIVTVYPYQAIGSDEPVTVTSVASLPSQWSAAGTLASAASSPLLELGAQSTPNLGHTGTLQGSTEASPKGYPIPTQLGSNGVSLDLGRVVRSGVVGDGVPERTTDEILTTANIASVAVGVPVQAAGGVGTHVGTAGISVAATQSVHQVAPRMQPVTLTAAADLEQANASQFKATSEQVAAQPQTSAARIPMQVNTTQLQAATVQPQVSAGQSSVAAAPLSVADAEEQQAAATVQQLVEIGQPVQVTVQQTLNVVGQSLGVAQQQMTAALQTTVTSRALQQLVPAQFATPEPGVVSDSFPEMSGELVPEAGLTQVRLGDLSAQHGSPAQMQRTSDQHTQSAVALSQPPPVSTSDMIEVSPDTRWVAVERVGKDDFSSIQAQVPDPVGARNSNVQSTLGERENMPALLGRIGLFSVVGDTTFIKPTVTSDIVPDSYNVQLNLSQAIQNEVSPTRPVGWPVTDSKLGMQAAHTVTTMSGATSNNTASAHQETNAGFEQHGQNGEAPGMSQFVLLDATQLGLQFQGQVANRPTAEINAAGPTVQWDTLASQVTEAMAQSPDGEVNFRINVKPESLGAVQLEVTMRGGKLSATFTAEKADALSVIEAGLPHLQQRLLGDGMNLKEITLEVTQGSRGAASLAAEMGSGSFRHDQEGRNGSDFAQTGGRSFTFSDGAGSFTNNSHAQGYSSGGWGQGQRQGYRMFSQEAPGETELPLIARFHGTTTGYRQERRPGVDLRV